ncbi:MAG: hypothetical protein FWC00_04980 [Firmicutes bacterium]|nr:hypothetical protein [Bacillota bacterium]
MRLRKLLQTACRLLGVEVRASSHNMVILQRCVNLVLSDIATRYIDFRAKQTFDVTNRKIEFTSFDKNVFRIRSVMIGGRAIDYDLYFDFLVVPNGPITVEYSYIPAFVSRMSNISEVAPGITESVLLYGMLAEYSAVAGLQSDFRIFTKKYESALFDLTKSGRLRVVASR